MAEDVPLEMCKCGHLRRCHEDTVGGQCKGHGACKVCDCRKFTWVDFDFGRGKYGSE